MIGIAVFAGEVELTDKFGRATDQQRTDDRVFVRIEVDENVSQRAFEQIADGNTLANVQMPEGVYVHTLRMS